MPITLSELIEHCETLELDIMLPEGRDSEFGVRFETASYVNPSGERSLLLVCEVHDNGQYVEVYAPRALDASNCRYKAALFAVMLQIGFMTRHLQLEHDQTDGEVRFAVDIPVADGTVTAHQLRYMIRCLIQCLEEFYPVLRHAMDTGKIDFERRWTPPSAPKAEPPSMPPEVQALIAQAGGIENLEAIVENLRKGRAAQ